MYLYLGDLFTRGLLKPYQDFGTARIYAPLSYLIPGQLEKWFGTSLDTGRFFSVFCGMLLVATIWWTAKRLGNSWWAAGVVWAMALTPNSSQVYSLAISEALAACLAAGSLAFTLGEDRPLWKILAGSILAGLAVMTRQNMLPLIPLLVAYIFWQHGRKAGWASIAAALLPVLFFHILYWPNILQLWATWLPRGIVPSLDAYRFPAVDVPATLPIPLFERFFILSQGFRFHYITLVGFVCCLFLWPRRSDWTSLSNRKAAIFLAAFFFIMVLAHAWVTIVMQNRDLNCPYCFTPYLAYFDFSVLILIVVTAPAWKKKFSTLNPFGVVAFWTLLSGMLGYGTFERFGPWVLKFQLPAVTRGRNPFKWLPFITVQNILANKFDSEFWTARAPVAAIAGLFLGFLFLISVVIVYRSVKKRYALSISFGSFLLTGILALGVIVSPLTYGNYRDKGQCKANILTTAREVAATLDDTVPKGATVYWAVNSAVPLLYARNIKIHIPQVTSSVYFRVGGQANELLRQGLWNEAIARQWLAEDDYIIAEGNWRARPNYPQYLDFSKYYKIETVPANPCDASSYLVIYHKKP